MKNIAIILSGGVGSRMRSEIPKQYIEINSKPIALYSIETFLRNKTIDSIVIIVADEWKCYMEKTLSHLNPDKAIYYATSGETRQYSIYNGLLEAKRRGAKDDDIVIIHDAARPLVSEFLIDSCIAGCKEADGVLPVVPVKDTLYQSKDGCNITSLLNRSELFAGQAPEAFKFGLYLGLHESISHEELLKINGSTEIAYKGGLKIKMIRGEERNFKITTPEDLSNFESIVMNTK